MASSTSFLILHTINCPSFLLSRSTDTVRRRSTGVARASAPGSSGNVRLPSSSLSSSSSNWWSTIFGWSSEPDYINGSDPKVAEDQPPPGSADGGEEEDRRLSRRGGSSRFSRGCFTEEKARQLRMKTMETSTFHDVMYHSAIASRLASSLPDRPRGNASGRSSSLDS